MEDSHKSQAVEDFMRHFSGVGGGGGGQIEKNNRQDELLQMLKNMTREESIEALKQAQIFSHSCAAALAFFQKSMSDELGFIPDAYVYVDE